jgi:hypothetical protein
MSWKKKAPIAGALGVVAIGGVAMTVPASAATVPAGEVTTQSVQQVVDGEGEERPGRHGRHHRGMRGTAVAEQLGIEVEVYRDAVKAVVEARQDAGEERPNPADMTPAERLAARADWIADVAAELSISAVELEAAHDAVFQAKLDEKVADGTITQAEADEMLAAYEDGTLFDLRQDQRFERIGDKVEDLLENGVIDDTQYDALQAALEAEDTETLRELLRELREDNGFRGRGGPGSGDAGTDGISL